jgi:F-type H+-transporting ATPase subunit epsilon
MNKIDLKLVTPEKTLFEEDFESITLETEMGQITVLPNHAPLVASLVPGEFVVRRASEENFVHIDGGFVTISESGLVIILADAAERLDEIDEKIEEEAIERAKVALAEEQMSSEEIAETEASILRGLSKLNVVRRRRSRSGAFSNVSDGLNK